MTSAPRLILASRSPRRREILGWLGLEFETVDPDVDELTGGDDPERLVLENARLKAAAGFEAAGEPDDAMVLGVDTDVFVDGRMFGQPADRAQAEERLRLLSGREHEVLSGVCLIGPRATGIPGAPLKARSGVSRSVVTFRDLDDATIATYLDSQEWREGRRVRDPGPRLDADRKGRGRLLERGRIADSGASGPRSRTGIARTGKP